LASVALLAVNGKMVAATAAEGEAATGAAPEAAPQEEGTLYIRQFRVSGAKTVPQVEVERAVYPYLGPGRTAEDVEQARVALEKVYHDKGFNTVAVQVPEQTVGRGIIKLEVVENRVGQLKVKGARFFSIDKIKKKIPSLSPGALPNFDEVTREIIALNQWPDLRITPSLKAGLAPGTVDVELEVKDKFPLHGSLELNNRYSADTTELRLNGSLSYNNLWQLGHGVGFSFQIAPENTDDALVYSGFYLARVPNIDWLSFIVQGTKQDSDVSTLGGFGVAGRGETLGVRAMMTLPVRPPNSGSFFHSLSFGIDYKRYYQDLRMLAVAGGAETPVSSTPIRYWPFSINYGGTWMAKKSVTELNAGVVFGLRGLGSDGVAFDNRRYDSDSSFIYFRGDLSRLQDLPGDFKLFAKIQGQISDQPLVDTEQFTGGGLSTARGYLESDVVGDNAIFGTLELRTPSLLGWLDKDAYEWRFYAFADAGITTLKSVLPEQVSRYDVASFGFGSQIKLRDSVYGSLDMGIPLITQNQTDAWDPLFTFRVWAEF
jgi:hemolysin activation/secretion protein